MAPDKFLIPLWKLTEMLVPTTLSCNAEDVLPQCLTRQIWNANFSCQNNTCCFLAPYVLHIETWCMLAVLELIKAMFSVLRSLSFLVCFPLISCTDVRVSLNYRMGQVGRDQSGSFDPTSLLRHILEHLAQDWIQTVLENFQWGRYSMSITRK